MKPAPAAPPPVPALRIVKRATSATVKPSSTSSRPSLGARVPIPPEVHVPAHKPALKGVQRPRPSKAGLVAPRGIVGVGSRVTKPATIVDGIEKPRQARMVGSVDGGLPAVAAPKTLRQPSLRLGAGKPAQQTTSSIAGVGVASVRQPSFSRLPAPGSRMNGKFGSSIPGPGTGIGR